MIGEQEYPVRQSPMKKNYSLQILFQSLPVSFVSNFPPPPSITGILDVLVITLPSVLISISVVCGLLYCFFESIV